MQHDLLFEFPDRIEICEGMVISLTYELHTSRSGKSFKAFKNVDTMFFKLIKENACYRKSYPEISFVAFDQIKHDAVGRKIACFRRSVEILEVYFRILVNMVMVNIEKSIVLQPERLIDVKEKTDAWHFPTFSMQYEPVDIDDFFGSFFPVNTS
jgi:hypothetical protein